MSDDELREYAHDLLWDMSVLMMQRPSLSDATLKVCQAIEALDQVEVQNRALKHSEN